MESGKVISILCNRAGGSSLRRLFARDPPISPLVKGGFLSTAARGCAQRMDESCNKWYPAAPRRGCAPGSPAHAPEAGGQGDSSPTSILFFPLNSPFFLHKNLIYRPSGIYFVRPQPFCFHYTFNRGAGVCITSHGLPLGQEPWEFCIRLSPQDGS